MLAIVLTGTTAVVAVSIALAVVVAGVVFQVRDLATERRAARLAPRAREKQLEIKLEEDPE
jgi:hypothetical protein